MPNKIDWLRDIDEAEEYISKLPEDKTVAILLLNYEDSYPSYGATGGKLSRTIKSIYTVVGWMPVDVNHYNKWKAEKKAKRHCSSCGIKCAKNDRAYALCRVINRNIGDYLMWTPINEQSEKEEEIYEVNLKCHEDCAYPCGTVNKKTIKTMADEARSFAKRIPMCSSESSAIDKALYHCLKAWAESQEEEIND